MHWFNAIVAPFSLGISTFEFILRIFNEKYLFTIRKNIQYWLGLMHQLFLCSRFRTRNQ